MGKLYPQRARHLLAFAARYGRERDSAVKIHLSLTQSDLAGLAGASRKRVNQTMVFFKERGFIGADSDRRILLLDRGGLARFCE